MKPNLGRVDYPVEQRPSLGIAERNCNYYRLMGFVAIVTSVEELSSLPYLCAFNSDNMYRMFKGYFYLLLLINFIDMKIGSHPRINTPTEKTKIWRYIDFSQLISILINKSLFFSRADGFDDSHEGALPRRTRERREELLEGIPEDVSQNIIPTLSRGFTQFTYINCWHLGQTQSATMWGAYSNSDITVCIESTIGRFRDAINRSKSTGDDDEIYVHKIEYVDYDEFDIPEWDPINISDYLPPYLYKRQEFEAEHEVRGILQRQPSGAIRQTHDGAEFYIGDDRKEIGVEADNPSGGISVDVNLGILCRAIHVSEEVRPWKAKIVKQALNEYLEDECYSIPVKHSSIHTTKAVF